MKTNLFVLIPFVALFASLLSSCKSGSGPWQDFTACATNACVEEALAVKDAFLDNPQALLRQFDATYQKGEDHVIGWLYILRDSVLLNPAYASTDERFNMQQALIDAARPYANDPKLGEMAQSILSEIEVLAIISELEDNAEPYLPITGTYSFDLGERGTGELLVSIISGEAIAFKLAIVGSAPAHNQGTMEGMAFLTTPNTYEHMTAEFGDPCKLLFSFGENGVTIKTTSGDPASCGFGNGVMADGEYAVVSHDDPFLSAQEAATAKKLNGRWVSEQDPQSELRIEKGLYTEVYNGEVMGSFPYKYFAKCPKDCVPVAPTPCLKVIGQDELCYTLVKVEGNRLELSLIGGNGSTLAFRRL